MYLHPSYAVRPKREPFGCWTLGCGRDESKTASRSLPAGVKEAVAGWKGKHAWQSKPACYRRRVWCTWQIGKRFPRLDSPGQRIGHAGGLGYSRGQQCAQRRSIFDTGSKLCKQVRSIRLIDGRVILAGKRDVARSKQVQTKPDLTRSNELARSGALKRNDNNYAVMIICAQIAYNIATMKLLIIVFM